MIKNCHYCRTELNTDIRKKWRSFDRKDNNRGYERDNVVVCCNSCNTVKSDTFSYEQMVKLGQLIATF